MNAITFHLNSLKTRVTLLTLTIFVVSIWSLAFYASTMLYQDLQRLLGEQQFSATSALAADIDHELTDRQSALETIASEITSAMLRQPTAVQALLEQHPVLWRLFNDGLAFADGSGTVRADWPHVPGRIGVNFKERDYISGPLRDGKAIIGKPVRSKLTQNPSFVIAAPVKDARGTVIGVLGGVTDLNKPNFINQLTTGHYSKDSDLFLVAPQHRLVVTSSNKSRIMAILPEPGVSPALDLQAQGWEGTHVFINPLGAEVLTSVKQIPAAHWYVAVTLAIDQAYAPIRALQQRLLIAATLLTLLAGLLTWWLLRRQLAPLLSAVSTLSHLPTSGDFPSALPITRRDEVGHLIAGFNRLLETLHQREVALTQSELRFRTLIEWSPEALAVHRDGKIIYANPAAAKLMGARSKQDMVGKPMLELVHPESRQVVMERVKKATVMGDILPMVEEKFIRFDGTVIDVEVIGIIIDFDGQYACQVAVRDVTNRNRTNRELQASLRDQVALLNEVHHRVKNNLQVITSLLRLEAARSSQSETRTVLTDMQGRIRSMALLHESLYRSGVFASIDLGQYIKQLASQSFRALITSASAVRLEFELASVQVSLDQATPCGLLINELISNSLKHGFPDGRSGEVRIELKTLTADESVATLDAAPAGAGSPGKASRVRLRVSDTGIGLPADFNARRGQSLGLQLVEDLTRQLNATLEIGAGPGAQFSVTFALETSKVAPPVP